MDTYCPIKYLLGQSHSHCHSVTLHHLSCIGSGIVQSANESLTVCDDLDVRVVLVVVPLLVVLVQDALFQRQILRVVHLDVVLAELLDCLLLAHPTNAVLHWCKYSRGEVFEVDEGGRVLLFRHR